MTFNEARTELIKQLTTVYDSEEVKNIAGLVLEHISGMTAAEQLIAKKNYLTCEQLEDIDSITERLKKNEPVQYVLGEAWFAGMKFKVNKNVLIPRPETDELVDWILKEINAQYSMFNNQCSIIDIGTGSGCIPIALKKKLPAADISAVDVCSEALFTATENAVMHETEINFILLDFLDEEKWAGLRNYDIIVSNPPYIRKSEESMMHERVKENEPHLALFVPDEDALIFYRKLASFARTHLQNNGRLYVEINEALANEVAEVFEKSGLAAIEIRKDMQGKNRMIKASLTV
jgi:release factor glutamine methyltransferase